MRYANYGSASGLGRVAGAGAVLAAEQWPAGRDCGIAGLSPRHGGSGNGYGFLVLEGKQRVADRQGAERGMRTLTACMWGTALCRKAMEQCDRSFV